MPAPPATSAETSSRVVSIIVLVVSLLAVGAVALLTDDDGASAASPSGLSDGSGGGDSARSSSSGGGDDGGQGSTSAAKVRLTYASFPVPPGARREKVETPLGYRYWSIAGGRIPDVERYLVRELKALGYEWMHNPITTGNGANKKVVGYLGSIDLGRDDFKTATLNIDLGPPGFYDPDELWIELMLP